MEHCVAIGRLSQSRKSEDYLPLFRMAPEYPRRMLARGRQAIMDVSFIVDENGFVREPKIVNASEHSRGFEKAALRAVERFCYAPIVVDGMAVPVEDIRTRISFLLE